MTEETTVPSVFELQLQHPTEIELQERGYSVFRTALCGWYVARGDERHHCASWREFVELAEQLLAAG